ncbi:MAG TPA: hypothetical protein VF066_05420 [Thermoleophilaceae bacterium]
METGRRYVVFWRALAAGLLLGSVMVASVLLSRAGHDSETRPARTERAARLSPALPPMRARGCTDTWLKTAQTDWTVATNWSAGRVPTTADRVCVPEGAIVWLHGNATAVASIAVEGTLSLTDGAALVLDNPAQRSTVETLVLNHSKVGGRSPLVITGTFDWENRGELAGPAPVTVAKRANASFAPGPGGKGTVRAPLVINGRFDLASGALYVGSDVTNRGYMHVVYSSPTGHPAGLLDLRGRPLPEVNTGRDLKPGAPTGTSGKVPLAGP